MKKTTRQPAPPEGFRYQAEVLPLDEELALVAHFQNLPLKGFEFQANNGNTAFPP